MKYNLLKILKKIPKSCNESQLVYFEVINRLYGSKQSKLFEKHFINSNTTKRNTIILASYPKSGNTFFRFVWFNIIALSELEGTSIDFHILDENMPNELFFSDIKQNWEFKSLPCLLKTHEMCQDKYMDFKAIHLFRNPFDTMISCYHYFTNRESGPESRKLSILEKEYFNKSNLKFKGNFFDFILDHIDSYCQHFISWTKKENIIPISYEVLLSDIETCFMHLNYIFESLGLFVDRKILMKAINLSQPNLLHNKPHSDKMVNLGKMKFIRDSRINQWKHYYGDLELELIKNKLKNYHFTSIENLHDNYHGLTKEWYSWDKDYTS